MDELRELPVWALVVLPLVLLAQSTWLFIDARKRTKYYWFWGLWGLIQTPMPPLLYILFVRKGWKPGKRADGERKE
ncbi:sigmaY antisigma factor component [Paenibacillus sambharensis]|uniref:SigmaY antisigma factor component n=1 Tax=Paenibacillus sambharensis TaxID=1803190 RepID=A0A2W1LC53_9BACL|nr:sigmaY antisigma factor component [Paenibacillus sambharensis]PZD95690.1 sigmaY antisigma factor component [Paenibacillus sambharensis]